MSSDDSSVATATDNLKYIDRIKKEIAKQYGENICKSGNEILDRKTEILKFGPSLNAALMGGVPEGSITILSGKPKGGKTTTALSFLSYCQSINRHIYYFDVEWRLKPLNLSGIAGLKNDPENMTVIRSEKGRILRAEDHLSIAEKIIHSHPESVIIIDSASALCSEKEFNADMSASGRADGPRLLAQFTRKIKDAIAVNRVSLLIIQHMICNTSGFGSPFMEDGGEKIKFAMETKLRVKNTKNWTVGSGDNERIIGLILTWQLICGAYGSLPGSECTSYIRFGRGIDHTMEYIDLGLKLGFIEKAGAWFSYDGNKVQGEAKLYDYFESNSDKLNELKSKLCDIYGFDI